MLQRQGGVRKGVSRMVGEEAAPGVVTGAGRAQLGGPVAGCPRTGHGMFGGVRRAGGGLSADRSRDVRRRPRVRWQTHAPQRLTELAEGCVRYPVSVIFRPLWTWRDSLSGGTMTAPNNRERILPRLIDEEIKES